jgi:hypothetical protein
VNRVPTLPMLTVTKQGKIAFSVTNLGSVPVSVAMIKDAANVIPYESVRIPMPVSTLSRGYSAS